MASDPKPDGQLKSPANAAPASTDGLLELPALFDEDSTLAKLLQGIASMSGPECFRPPSTLRSAMERLGIPMAAE